MGYRGRSRWGIASARLRFTPAELGKCLVANSPPRGASESSSTSEVLVEDGVQLNALFIDLHLSVHLVEP